MEGVGPGTTLGGRYVTTTRIAQHGNAERWIANEPDLARSVALLCVPRDDARAEALLDAARVAAGLDIPTCVRVLDIGTDGPVAYVVEESLEDARSVAELVNTGGLPGDEVRRIAGEVATALATASARGVHHQRISPEEVFRTSEGTIKLRGLATAAALTGIEEGGDQAARADAKGVVALMYAGLTGRWPLPEPPTSLATAPQAFGGVAAPSEIAAGVPRDLDHLCRVTLTGRGGPGTAADLARQIAPWSSRPIVGRSTLLVESVPTAEPHGEPVPHTQPAASPAVAPAAQPAAPPPAGPVQPAQEASESAGTTAATAATAATAGMAAGAAGTATTTGTATTAAPSAGTSAATAAASGPAAQPRPAAAAPRGASIAAPLEPPIPGVQAEPLSQSQSRLALVIVAAFVVLALIVGVNGVRKIGSQTDLDLGAAAAATPSASATPGAAEGPQVKAILSADGFDPLGDNSENGDLAAKVFDGNPDTEWVSEGYRTANLGGLKPGAGVIVDLGPNVTPAIVRLTLKTPADVTVLLSGSRSLDGALTIGSLTDANGQVELPAPQDAGPHQYVIVWFTKLSQDGDGFFRAHLGELTVLG